MSFENKIGCTVHVLSMNQLYLRDQINIFEQAIAISNDSNIFNQIETTQVVVIFDFNRRLVYLRLLDAELEILNYYQTTFASFWSFLAPRSSDTYQKLVRDFSVLEILHQKIQLKNAPNWQQEGF